MLSKQIKFIFLLFIATAASNYGQVGLNKLAQSTMNFQLVSISPKASALGDAFYSLGTGAESIFYNPSGIVDMNSTLDVSLNYTGWIADINYLGAALAYNLGNFGTVGFSVLTVDYGEIIGTSLVDPSQQANYPAGYIDNGPVSNVGAYSVGLSYAKAISQQFSIGGTIRLAGQNLGTNSFVDGTNRDNNATKLVFDAGVRFKTDYKGFIFGMALRNFSSNIKREEVDEQLPLTFTMGGVIDILQFFSESKSNEEALMFALDFLHSNSYSERINLGLEYRFLGMVALRGGYQTNRDVASWSGGIGVNTTVMDSRVEVNYSYSKMEIFDNVNRISLNFSF